MHYKSYSPREQIDRMLSEHTHEETLPESSDPVVIIKDVPKLKKAILDLIDWWVANS